MIRLFVLWVLLQVACSAEPNSINNISQIPYNQSNLHTHALSQASSGWLYTQGNHLYTDNHQLWQARGANIPDTRSCGVCSSTPHVNDIIARIDELVDHWGANYIRLTMENWLSPGGLNDSQYIADLQHIIQHVGNKPGVYIQLSLWQDISLSPKGWPTAQTSAIWQQFTTLFIDQPHVLFGISGPIVGNYHGQDNEEIWQYINQTVEQIRQQEQALGSPYQHIVVVPALANWSRIADFYINQPIAAGHGKNIAYEVHINNFKEQFNAIFQYAAPALPLMIGSFGPKLGGMELADCQELMQLAELLTIPYAAWSFSMYCEPYLLEYHVEASCYAEAPITPSHWGIQLLEQLHKPYGGSWAVPNKN